LTAISKLATWKMSEQTARIPLATELGITFPTTDILLEDF
jgi:hypothetical protein